MNNLYLALANVNDAKIFVKLKFDIKKFSIFAFLNFSFNLGC